MNFSVCLAAAFAVLAAFTALGPVRSDGALFPMPQSADGQKLASRMDCPPASAIAFDKENQPYLLDNIDPAGYGSISTLRDGKWVQLPYIPVLQQLGVRAVQPTTRCFGGYGGIVFDDDDAMYVLTQGTTTSPDGEVANGDAVLLYSTDKGKSFTGYRLPFRPYQVALETSISGSRFSGPPALIAIQVLKTYPHKAAKVWDQIQSNALDFCSADKLSVFLPRKASTGLDLGEPVEISEKANEVPGIWGWQQVVTLNDRTYVTFNEVADTPETGGNPTYVAVIDRSARKEIDSQLVGVATPYVSDCHAMPQIALDHTDVIRVVSGSHGWLSTHAGFFTVEASAASNPPQWSRPEQLGAGQTYPVLAVDNANNLHLLYRGGARENTNNALEYQRLDPTTRKWSIPVALTCAPAGYMGYVNYMHRVFVDRNGALYVRFSLNQNTPTLFPLITIVSTDSGAAWHIASTRDFIKGLKSHGH